MKFARKLSLAIAAVGVGVGLLAATAPAHSGTSADSTWGYARTWPGQIR